MKDIKITDLERRHILRTYIGFLRNLNRNIARAEELYVSPKMVKKREEIYQARRDRLIIRSVIRNLK